MNTLIKHYYGVFIIGNNDPSGQQGKGNNDNDDVLSALEFNNTHPSIVILC